MVKNTLQFLYKMRKVFSLSHSLAAWRSPARVTSLVILTSEIVAAHILSGSDTKTNRETTRKKYMYKI